MFNTLFIVNLLMQQRPINRIIPTKRIQTQSRKKLSSGSNWQPWCHVFITLQYFWSSLVMLIYCSMYFVSIWSSPFSGCICLRFWLCSLSLSWVSFILMTNHFHTIMIPIHSICSWCSGFHRDAGCRTARHEVLPRVPSAPSQWIGEASWSNKYSGSSCAATPRRKQS